MEVGGTCSSGSTGRRMMAVVCSKTGSIPQHLGILSQEGGESAVLHLDLGFPRPSPSPQQEASGAWVRLRVAAASLNFADLLTVLGKYQVRPPLPFIPGAEVSGVVTAVGPAVASLRAGDRVCAVVGTGAFAEEVVTKEENVFILPPECDLAHAAALPVAYGTAHLSLCHRAHVQPGEVVLVLGAAGGVGLAAVQIAKLMGARVIAVARGSAKAMALRAAGADKVVDTSESDVGLIESVRTQLKAWNQELGPGEVRKTGVDVVVDTVGGKAFDESLRVVGWGARFLIIGFASGRIPKIAANIALVKNLTFHGIYWGSYMDHSPHIVHESMRQLIQWFGQGKLNVHVSHVFCLAQVLDAFQALLERAAIGKVLLTLPANGRL